MNRYGRYSFERERHREFTYRIFNTATDSKVPHTSVRLTVINAKCTILDGTKCVIDNTERDNDQVATIMCEI